MIDHTQLHYGTTLNDLDRIPNLYFKVTQSLAAVKIFLQQTQQNVHVTRSFARSLQQLSFLLIIVSS